MEWQNKIQVKKGNIGEDIVRINLEAKDYVVYKCITPKAHAIDYLAIKDKKNFLFIEIKSKARLNKYEATGIDLKNYNEYKTILQNGSIDIILFFVDEHPKQRCVYCQSLKVLMENKTIEGIKYPNFEIVKDKVLFHLKDMKKVCDLDDVQLEELKRYSTRKYEYE